MLDVREESTLLIRVRKNVRKLSTMKGKGWEYLWNQPCLAKMRFTWVPLAPGNWCEASVHTRRFWKQDMVVFFLESHESTRPRVELSLPKHHDDHIAGKGYTSVTHCNLVHKFIPMTPAKIPDAKAVVDKEWKKRDNSSLATVETPKQEGEYSLSTKRQKSPLCYTDGHASPEKTQS